MKIYVAGHDDIPFLVESNLAMAMETEAKQLDVVTVQRGVTAVIDNAHRGFYLVAVHEGQRAACLMITTEWSDWRAGDFWWIQSVFVKTDCRRQGIYRTLFEETLNRAEKENNVCGVRLYVEKDNHTAKKTYESLGMEETHYLLYERMIANQNAGKPQS